MPLSDPEEKCVSGLLTWCPPLEPIAKLIDKGEAIV